MRVVRIEAGPKVAASIRLPSKARIILGSSSSLHCPSQFTSSGERIGLINRTFFSITGSRGGFVINALGGSGVIMRKARFGMRTCGKDEAMRAALISNGIDFSCIGGNEEGGMVVVPKRGIVCSVIQRGIIIGRIGMSIRAY